ncbi:MAG: flavin reductase family protein [Thermoleophilia bacterium]|jgi:flavin reductase (DIM6/NTAB) family NADH-FMN oxidoreductase RutF
MVKKNIGKNFDICPMPVVIVGTLVDDKPNFMTVAWITKLSFNPPLVGISVGAKQHSVKGIRQNGEFSVNYPSVNEMELADYCGLVHGYDEDKTGHIDIFQGTLTHAPMVRQCPVNLECRLIQTVDLGEQFFFIGEVAHMYASERILSDDQVDLAKFSPFVLTMPGNSYRPLGEHIGDAWSIGRKLMEQPADS